MGWRKIVKVADVVCAYRYASYNAPSIAPHKWIVPAGILSDKSYEEDLTLAGITNTQLSAFLEMWLQSSAASSWDRATEVKANRTVNLRFNFLRGCFSIGSKADKCLRTGLTDQVEQDLGVVRLNWKIPSWIVTQQVGYPAVAQLLDHVIGNYRLCILKMSCTPNWVSWIVQLRKQTHHLQVLKGDIYSV